MGQMLVCAPKDLKDVSDLKNLAVRPPAEAEVVVYSDVCPSLQGERTADRVPS